LGTSTTPTEILQSARFQALVERQLEITALLSAIESALSGGTDGLRPEMKQYDFKKVSQMCAAKPAFVNLNLEQPPSVEQTFFGFEVNCAGKAIGFESRTHAEVLTALLKLVRRKTIPAAEALNMPLPETEAGAKRMLDLIKEKLKRQSQLLSERDDLETGLNEFVFDACALCASERAIVLDFLKRFSNAESAW
jgi:hypothetical protein